MLLFLKGGSLAIVRGHPEVHELMVQSFIRRVDQEEQSPNCLGDCSASPGQLMDDKEIPQPSLG